MFPIGINGLSMFCVNRVLFHIFDLKSYCPWLAVFAAWKIFLQKQLWAENVQVNCKQSVKCLGPPMLIILEMSLYLTLTIVSISLTRHLYSS